MGGGLAIFLALDVEGGKEGKERRSGIQKGGKNSPDSVGEGEGEKSFVGGGGKRPTMQRVFWEGMGERKRDQKQQRVEKDIEKRKWGIECIGNFTQRRKREALPPQEKEKRKGK